MGGALLQTALLGYCLFETGRAGWQDELDLRNPTEALLLAAALSSTEGAGLVDESRFGRIHSLLHGEGVDLVFAPPAEEMYLRETVHSCFPKPWCLVRSDSELKRPRILKVS